jgi:hypothetical protein
VNKVRDKMVVKKPKQEVQREKTAAEKAREYSKQVPKPK